MHFLTADWKDLVMCNWQVDPDLLKPFLPAGCEVDFFENKAYVSLVAFRFLNTRVLGIPIPYHINFDEVNLRFYVQHQADSELRRGVVFIQEYVPRFWIAKIARLLYNENYFAGPTESLIEKQSDSTTLFYKWGKKPGNTISVTAGNELSSLSEGSLEEFIAQHYFGYAKQRDGATVEYRVSHPRWRMQKALEVRLNGNFQSMYGEHFARIMGRHCDSCFVAEGSLVEVGFGRRI